MTFFALIVSALVLSPPAPFVDVDRAAALVGAHAVVLDARGKGDFERGHLPGAVSIDWKDFRDGWGRTGRIDDSDAALSKKLAALGVDDRRPVLVYGAANQGWGEEGRIDWMLDYLGLRDVHILDGGFAAWRDTHRPLEVGRARPHALGSVTPRRQEADRAGLPEVERASHGAGPMLLDVRTRDEWNGATPYYEPRGGHIPAARQLPWTALIDAHGKLLPIDAVEHALTAIGISKQTPIIVYCTGGVRSAFAWAVLRASGFADVRNFDGSFYLWAKHKELPVVVGDPK